jgi:hypothetical protein
MISLSQETPRLFMELEGSLSDQNSPHVNVYRTKFTNVTRNQNHQQNNSIIAGTNLYENVDKDVSVLEEH